MISFFLSGGGVSSRMTKKKKTIINVKLKKGELTKYGYKNVKSLSKTKRRKALNKAVKKYGHGKVIRKLSILRTYNKNKNPKLSKKFRNNMVYVQKKKKRNNKKV